MELNHEMEISSWDYVLGKQRYFNEHTILDIRVNSDFPELSHWIKIKYDAFEIARD